MALNLARAVAKATGKPSALAVAGGSLNTAVSAITSSNTATNPENTVLAKQLTANAPVTWSIVGGVDAARFEIAGSVLRWLGNGTKDFETPNDSDTNNTYVVNIRATDALTNTVNQTITVTVTDVDEVAPTITSSSSPSVAENSVLAHALTANETVTWAIIGGADQARFELSGSTLRWLGNGTKDYETPNDADTNNTYVVQVRATDTAGNQTNQTITVTVTDVGEAGSSIAIDFVADTYNIAGNNYTSLATALASANITFSRASAAFYTNTSGVMTSVSSGALRRGNKGALIEPSATNLILRSRDIDNATWNKLGYGVAADFKNGADGTQAMDDFSGSGNSQHYVNQSYTGWTSGQDYVFSVVVDPNSNVRPGLTVDTAVASGGPYANYAFDTLGISQSGGGVVGTFLEQLQNGLVRFGIRVTATATATGAAYVYSSNDGVSGRLPTYNSSANYQIDMGQLELADPRGPSSPITTTSATVTRAADAFGIALPAGLWNLKFTFDDNSVQYIAGITGGTTFTVPTNLNRYYIKKIESYTLVDPTSLDATNTGAILGGSFTNAPGGIYTSSDGQVIQNMNVTGGYIHVQHNNVTIQNCKIASNDYYGIAIDTGKTGTMIRYNEISLCANKGILGHDMTVIRNNIHDCNDAASMNGSNVLFQENYFWSFPAPPESHLDGIEVYSCNNIVIRSNRIINTRGDTSCVNVSKYDAGSSAPYDITIDNNYLSGGSYTVYMNDITNPSSSSLTNNTIVAGSFGTLTSNITGFINSGNTFL